MSDATQTAESLEPETEEQLENQRIGRRLRALRTERGMTILEMAVRSSAGRPTPRSAPCRNFVLHSA